VKRSPNLIVWAMLSSTVRDPKYCEPNGVGNCTLKTRNRYMSVVQESEEIPADRLSTRREMSLESIHLGCGGMNVLEAVRIQAYCEKV